MKLFLSTLVLAATLALVAVVQAAPSPSRPSATTSALTTDANVRMPFVVGMRMDRATRTLRAKGLRVNEECSGFFGCIIKANWWICAQSPRAGRYVPRYSVVVIYGERRGEC